MSEPVSNDVSTESLCTVIDAKLINNNYKDFKENGYYSEEPQYNDNKSIESVGNKTKTNGHLSSSAFEDTECETDPEKGIIKSTPKGKLKKSVSFDPNDEKVKKFIQGEPIIDQQNPFKSNSLGKNHKKKVPPPVPTKRSTLSVRKTVTQQLREREREKEKERERLKNEVNLRKSSTNGSLANGTLNSPDEFITTEEVLKQSKYVKTYIKNPDPYFVYDPTVLAKIKFEELRELVDKKPPRKLKLKEQVKSTSRKVNGDFKPKVLTFKKCSKPNYPELSDIKIKVGTESDGSYFNPAEVTKNAKKFDERVKKLHINSEDDLDEIDGPLTKSESSDEVTTNTLNSPLTEEEHNQLNKTEDKRFEEAMQNFSDLQANQPKEEGTFTNTIKSKEFQEYLEKKGLTLIPKKIPNGAQNPYQPNKNYQASYKAPGQAKISAMPIQREESPPRKLSVFQRLLANSIFASRRRTTPKEPVPTPRSLQQSDNQTPAKVNPRTPLPIKRVVLERQSFHGRPKATNHLLSSSESNALKRQTERSRKSFASGDDLSLSISSALTNAENDEIENISSEPNLKAEAQARAIAKPPRRSLSRDRLNKTSETLRKPNGFVPSQKPEIPLKPSKDTTDGPHFRRSLERQSLIPKRSMPEAERRQVFDRSSSMDRNEILKRSGMKGFQLSSKSIPDNSEDTTSKLNPEMLKNGPIMTSTPIREASASNAENQSFVPVQVLPTTKSSNIRINHEEWQKLKAMKEKTDQELFNKVLQQQQSNRESQPQLDNENIYEHLRNQQQTPQQLTQLPSQQTPQQNFLRGSPQRNTFSGVIRNRQVKIIDGKPLMFNEEIEGPSVSSSSESNGGNGRSQSVLDNMTKEVQKQVPNTRRGYESESETPVVYRKKSAESEKPVEPRRIGGLLTREEILQKVKEFCRKSLNKTPSNTNNQHTPMQAIYEQQATNSTDLSPVSYASVETHNRSVSRIYAAPQVPQRLHSLPQQFVPIKQELVAVEPAVINPSPIYAHVIKRGSLQSQPSNDLYETPQRPVLVRRSSDAKTVYLTQTPSIQFPAEQTYSSLPTQYVLVDGDKLTPAHIVSYKPTADIYAQPQYIRPTQLQPIPSPYGYITVREPLTQVQSLQLQNQQSKFQQLQQQPQFLRQRIHDGRSTPLILDRSSQQASQIYWTPQHQRLQQHSGLIPVQISPRYVIKQPVYQVPTQRTSTLISTSSTQQNYKPTSKEIIYKELEHQQQQHQQFSPIVRIQTPTQQSQRQSLQRVQQYEPDNEQVHQIQRQPIEVSDWESGSEAGEVRRILENQSKHGESKSSSSSSSFLKEIKKKLSRLVGNL